MARKELVTILDWKLLVLAWFRAEEAVKNEQYRQILLQVSEQAVALWFRSHDPAIAIIKCQVSNTMANRLYAGSEDQALLSKADFSFLVPLLLQLHENAEGIMSAKKRAVFERTMKKFMEILVDLLIKGVMIGENPYEAWRKIAEVSIDLGEQYGMSPYEALVRKRDKVIKEVFTREQYRARIQDDVDRSLDPNFYRDLFLQGVRGIAGDDEDGYGRAEKEVDICIAKFNPFLVKARPILNDWVQGEILRIYGPLSLEEISQMADEALASYAEDQRLDQKIDEAFARLNAKQVGFPGWEGDIFAIMSETAPPKE